MAKKPCACGQDKAKRRTRCIECWLRAQPMQYRAEVAKRRISMIPEEFRLKRVPKDDWPPGRRWCAGCQSFVLLKDASASRCKACLSIGAHASAVQRTYGISADEYNAILAAQGGRCYICQRRTHTKRLAVDHDHATGEVRGLLCADSERGCNHAILGNIRDVEMARRIVAYLESPPARRVLGASQ